MVRRAAKLCCFITHPPISNSTEQGCGCGDLFRASLSFLLRSTSPSIGDSCRSVFTVGSLTTTIESITATNLVIGGVPMTIFDGTSDFTAPGFDRRVGTFGFSTQGNGPVTFSATGAANSPGA